MKTKTLLATLISITAIGMAGCTQSAKVSHNVSQQADNFNVDRRVAVINMRTDNVVFEVIGRVSIETGSDRLNVIVEAEDGVYKKHMINLTDWNMYVVEDLHGAEVGKYRYEVNYMPESIVPFDIISTD